MRGTTKKNASPIDEAFEAPIDIAPIMKALRSRATSASTLFANANRERIAKRVGKHAIGRWRKVVSKMFRKLPQEEQDHWHAQAKQLKTNLVHAINVWFEYVHSAINHTRHAER